MELCGHPGEDLSDRVPSIFRDLFRIRSLFSPCRAFALKRFQSGGPEARVWGLPFAGGLTVTPAPFVPSPGVSITAILLTIFRGTCAKCVFGFFSLAIKMYP